MSDTSQGPGWWQAPDGKWFPPQTPTMPAQLVAPAKGNNKGCWIAFAVSMLVLLLITGAVLWFAVWAFRETKTAVEQTVDSTIGEVPGLPSIGQGSVEDVRITRCESTKAGDRLTPRATLEITNNSTDALNYAVTVKFVRRDNGTELGTGVGGAPSVEAGTTATGTALFVGLPPETPVAFDCQVENVIAVATTN